MNIEIGINHHYAANLYAKECHIPAGVVLVQHQHKTDHLSILAKGRVRLIVGDEMQEHEGPCCLNIGAGAHHGLLALTDTVWFCVHGGVDALVDDASVVAEESDLVEVERAARRLQEGA